jgi:hypothetical protein
MKTIQLLALTLCLLTLQAVSAGSLKDDFRDPPKWTQPWCYWFFLDGDISKEGITKDLEKMKELGIQQAIVMHVQNGKPKPDYVRMMSPRWMELKRFALKEAARCGIGISLHNCPGWSNAGGPWIKPEPSLRRVSWNEFDAQGGTFSKNVRPEGIPAGQDIAVLAVPRLDAVTIEGSKGNDKTLTFKHTRSFTARALVVHGKGKGKLYSLKGGQRKLVAEVSTGRANRMTDFLPNGIETFSFNDTKSQEFVLEGNFKCKVELTSEPKVAQVIEKQMGRMFPSPMPHWDSYIFTNTAQPDSNEVVIDPKKIINLSDKLKADGSLVCELPDGQWTVIWFGMKPTGKTNVPASPEGTGLEVDKMSKSAIKYHFNSMVGKIINELSEEERSALNGVSIDSYEVGAQNWTDGFDQMFLERVGYDPIPMLPVFTGRVVESAKASDMFLWNLRRQVADLISINYVGGLREVGNKHGLKLWLENYGHWGYPGEFLMFGGYSDYVAGEFWSTAALGNIECRAASSSGHIYGKNRIYAEAYTSSINLQHHPAFFKARGEQMFCEGINHFVLTVSIHQPRTGIPGKNPWYGTAFHRNTPWYNKSHSFVKYLQRIHLMLQKGNPIADVAVYIGDFAPQMTGPPNPVPTGYDFDYINSDVIMNRLKVVDGQWVVYDEHDPKRVAARWKLLAMPMDKLKHIRPQVLASLDKLKKQGGQFVESVPVTPDYLAKLGVSPDVSDTTCPIRWKHRKTADADIYFVCNFEKTGAFSATFRSKGKSVEILNPYNGDRYQTAWFKDVASGTQVTLDVKDKSDSFFVVIRKDKPVSSVVSVKHNGQDVSADSIKLSYNKNGKLVAATALGGTFDVQLSNGKSHRITVESVSEQPLNGPWNIHFGNENSTATEAFDIKTDKLVSWDKLPDDRAKKFTGTADYETTFTIDPKLLKSGRRVFLDLGSVNVMAGITVNGHTLDTLWMPPFKADNTELLKNGRNQLNVEITSTSPCASPGLLGPVRLTFSNMNELSK